MFLFCGLVHIFISVFVNDEKFKIGYSHGSISTVNVQEIIKE